MRKITKRQAEIFEIICRWIIEKRYAPTIREIGRVAGLSEKAAHDHVQMLQKKGYLAYLPGQPRTIKIKKLSHVFYGLVGELPIQIAPLGTASQETS